MHDIDFNYLIMVAVFTAGVYYATQRTKRAQRECASAIDHASKHMKAQQWTEAELHLQLALKALPTNASARYLMGYTQYQLGKYEQAATSLEVAANTLINNKDVWLGSVIRDN